MKIKLGFFLKSIIIFGISLSMLIPIVKSFESTKYLGYMWQTGWGLPQLNEGDFLRWSFVTYDEEFYVKVWVEDPGKGNYLLSENLTKDGRDWIVPSDAVGSDCIINFENIDHTLQREGYIDIYFEINPEPEAIPGFNLFFLLGIFSVVTILITKNLKKT